jgi:hypothetical protein
MTPSPMMLIVPRGIFEVWILFAVIFATFFQEHWVDVLDSYSRFPELPAILDVEGFQNYLDNPNLHYTICFGILKTNLTTLITRVHHGRVSEIKL